jgi:transcriptional regulator with GAF, ATPase, and Fis domain
MTDATPVTAWLHCSDAAPAFPLSDIAAALRRAGVVAELAASLLQVEAPSEAGRFETHSKPTILFFSAVTPELCDLVRSHSQHGLRRLLAVTAHEVLANSTAWQVLEAGASDVLAWDAAGATTETIAARVQRWHEVDSIVGSDLVQNHVVGRSPVWMGLLRQIVEVARFAEPDDASALLTGETGTGKELIARLIHALSPRRAGGPFVILDCTTIVPELSGSELFGHERGAFTGAIAARDGAFALADGGTLFLDEVGELPLALQAQLLRVVQERTFKRVGGNAWQKTDFRLVCATNRNLLEEEASGRFRRDLYYRIAGWGFKLPPLRERPEDILPMAHAFLKQRRPGQEPPQLDKPVKKYLLSRAYPGNVRDLRNLVLRLAERHVGAGPITIGDIPADERPPVMPLGESWRTLAFEQNVRHALLYGARLREIRRAAEETAIDIAMRQEASNVRRAARLLGITERALQMRRAERQQQGGDGGRPEGG